MFSVDRLFHLSSLKIFACCLSNPTICSICLLSTSFQGKISAETRYITLQTSIGFDLFINVIVRMRAKQSSSNTYDPDGLSTVYASTSSDYLLADTLSDDVTINDAHRISIPNVPRSNIITRTAPGLLPINDSTNSLLTP